ncbi:hypothetical protein P3T36_007200 [Kitasatospora sp. MAP12-15]|nr:hypothetical protein [Kitasatospora sp. MAP12-44]
MMTWWLVLISRSRSDSATTGLGKSGYQSLGARLLVMIRDRPCRSLTSSLLVCDTADDAALLVRQALEQGLIEAADPTATGAPPSR